MPELDNNRVLAALMGGSLTAAAAYVADAPGIAIALTGAISAASAWIAAGSFSNAAEPPQSPGISLSLSEAGPDYAGQITTIIDTIDDPLLLIERQRITKANRAAIALFGVDKLGEDFRLAIRQPAAAELIASAVLEETDSAIEVVGIGQTDRRWVLTVHQIGPDARVVRLHDRTESWAAERMRVDFVANASHELRTPLAALLGFIETLEDSKASEDPATRDRFLKIMHGEGRRMQQLVDDLISLSRIEADRFSVPQTKVSLGTLIEEVVGVIRSSMREGADRIISEIEDIPPIRADRAQISQLLHNLISNALKYGKAATPVRVSLRKIAPDSVQLRVRDQGEGIPPEHIPRLTERFYRVDASRSRAVGGTGLGLAIVKHIAERHRARLEIASEVGRGTVVSVTFRAEAALIAPNAMSLNRHDNETEDAFLSHGTDAGHT